MNTEKIGKFILKLRTEANLTQQELADKIPIGRGAVSKWERNITIPDSSTLVRLSEIFNVSINEILYGERKNQTNMVEVNNVTAQIYNSNRKIKKTLIIAILIIIVLIFLFLSYYFLSFYKSVDVYTINSISDNILFDGILVNTKEEFYLRINQFSNNDNINTLKLCYDETNCVIGVDDNIYITSYYGYNEYFDTNNIENILDKLYLSVIYDDGTSKKIQLDFIKDYTNDNLFFINKNKISKNEKVLTQNSENIITQELSDKIKKNYEQKDDNYIYSLKEHNTVINYTYLVSSNLIMITKITNKVSEDWQYDLSNGYLFYTNNEINSFEYQNGNINCLTANCKNEKEKIDEFNNLLYKSL